MSKKAAEFFNNPLKPHIFPVKFSGEKAADFLKMGKKGQYFQLLENKL